MVDERGCALAAPSPRARIPVGSRCLAAASAYPAQAARAATPPAEPTTTGRSRADHSHDPGNPRRRSNSTAQTTSRPSSPAPSTGSVDYLERWENNSDLDTARGAPPIVPTMSLTVGDAPLHAAWGDRPSDRGGGGARTGLRRRCANDGIRLVRRVPPPAMASRGMAHQRHGRGMRCESKRDPGRRARAPRHHDGSPPGKPAVPAARASATRSTEDRRLDQVERPLITMAEMPTQPAEFLVAHLEAMAS